MSASEDSKGPFNGEDEEFEAILKHLRNSVKTKHGLIKKEKVEYANGAKLIDGLMSSQWAQSDSPYFQSRDDAIKYCQKLVDKQLLVGGKKIEMQKAKKEDEEAEEEEDNSKKKVRRFRIDWQQTKKFMDSNEEIFIWRYDPPNRYRFLIGVGVMLVIIAFTLQPLWPESSKYGMWYISVLFMILLGALLVVYIVRWFMWGLLFTVSLGKIRFWLLPNLDNERLGVLESFKPLYSLKFKKKKKSKKDQKQEVDDDKSKEKTKED